MPIGDSHIIFIAYNEEGVAGEITEVEYSLTLDTEIEVGDLIETVEENPDTVISLINGKKIIVKEDRQEIKNLVKSYKRDIMIN